MNYIFYHIYLTEGVEIIVQDQINTLIASGILEESELHTTIMGENLHPSFKKVLSLVKPYSKVISTESLNLHEIYTQGLLYNHAVSTSDTHNYLYMHTKGCTRIHSTPSGLYSYRNVENWRKRMEYFNILQYKACIQTLRDVDVVGIHYVPQNYVPNTPAHYSGGFWWTTSTYVRNLPNPWDYLKDTPVDRFNAEFWIGRISHKAACLYPIPVEYELHNSSLYYLDESIYKANPKISIHTLII